MSPSAVCEVSPESQGLLNGHNGNGSFTAVKPSNGTVSLAESLAGLQTEQKNSKTTNIDSMSSLELCRKLDSLGERGRMLTIDCLGVINEEDASVAQAVQTCLPQIADAIDIIVPRLLSGGRVIYTGAGTSGR
jgi:N-acetylmuramic acid 6-phosphate etherase